MSRPDPPKPNSTAGRTSERPTFGRAPRPPAAASAPRVASPSPIALDAARLHQRAPRPLAVAAQRASVSPAATQAPTTTDASDALPHLPPTARDRLATLTAAADAPADAQPPAAVPQRVADRADSSDEPARKRPARGGLLGWLIDRLLRRGRVADAIDESRSAFAALGLFSLVINVLMLAGPLFMLQVYDRVMTSGSMPTLVALLAITLAIYAVIGVLELVRSRLVARIGADIDRRLGEPVLDAALRRAVTSRGATGTAQRDLEGFRQFVAGPGPITFFDAPWTPIYLLVVLAVHWSLGLLAITGAAALLLVAWLSDGDSRESLIESSRATAEASEMAETGQRNAEAIVAMGMLGAYRRRWSQANGEALTWQLLAADRIGTYAALSKTLRLVLQSLLLALGAALAVTGAISAGSIVACTIIFGRALAPVEQIIGQWRAFQRARECLGRLEDLLSSVPAPVQRTALPTPRGHLQVHDLSVAAVGTRQVILSNVDFEAKPGQMLAVIGPSAAGKSTLVRAIAGLWPPTRGSILLDGSRLDQWPSEALGRHIGYLPQSVELLPGTVRDNIARFRCDVADQEVIAAAQMARAHELILALPAGYDTMLGAAALQLSGGQRQRIGLARALLGHPPLVVLDEPNSNLDRPGDEALSAAIDDMRARRQTVILVSHRVQAINKADTLLYLQGGTQRAFGPRAEVLRMFQGMSDVELPNRRRNDGHQGDRLNRSGAA